MKATFFFNKYFFPQFSYYCSFKYTYKLSRKTQSKEILKKIKYNSSIKYFYVLISSTRKKLILFNFDTIISKESSNAAEERIGFKTGMSFPDSWPLKLQWSLLEKKGKDLDTLVDEKWKTVFHRD